MGAERIPETTKHSRPTVTEPIPTEGNWNPNESSNGDNLLNPRQPLLPQSVAYPDVVIRGEIGSLGDGAVR